MTDKLLVLSTAESPAQARSLAHGLVAEKLAACVNIIPGLTSVYQWKEEIEESAEVLVVIKTSQRLFGEVRDYIERAHSYELPEVLAIPVEGGSERYLEWFSAQLRAPGETAI